MKKVSKHEMFIGIFDHLFYYASQYYAYYITIDY